MLQFIAIVTALMTTSAPPPAWHTETQTYEGRSFSYEMLRLPDHRVAAIELVWWESDALFYAWEVSCNGSLVARGDVYGQGALGKAKDIAASTMSGTVCK